MYAQIKLSIFFFFRWINATSSPNLRSDSPEYCKGEFLKKQRIQSKITTVVLAIFFVSLLGVGMGQTAVYTLGIPYIDDNVASRESPLYFGEDALLARSPRPARSSLVSPSGLPSSAHPTPFFPLAGERRKLLRSARRFRRDSGARNVLMGRN